MRLVWKCGGLWIGLQGGRTNILPPEGESYEEYYAKSRQKILTQGEIDKVKNELEDLIMNLEG